MQESLDGVVVNSKHRANSTFHNQNVFIVRVLPSSFATKVEIMRSQLDALWTVKLRVESEKKNGNFIEDFVGGGRNKTKQIIKAANCRKVHLK